MKTSKNGIEFIKSFEGCRLTAYKAVSTEKYYTIGYGHYGADVTKGMKITQSQADAYLVKDLVKFEARVNKYQSKYNFNQNQFDALVSFAYNVGSIDGLTANGKRTIAQISNKFGEYNKSGGKVLAGLTKRRLKERQLFNKAASFVSGGVDYSKVFDAAFYASKNPDVVNVYGNDPAKLFEHFITFGCNESSRAGKTIATFNVLVYATHNPDLVKVYGEGKDGNFKPFYKHYCTNGYMEKTRRII